MMEIPYSGKKWKQPSPSTEKIVDEIVNWSISRIIDGLLDEKDNLDIAHEFAEWLEPEGDKIKIFSLDLNQ